MIIEVKKIAKEQKIKIPDLITRPVGRALYERVRSNLQFLTDGEVVLLDFEGIMVMDTSFIDEFLVKIILDSRKESPDFFVKAINLSEISIMNIESVFNSYYQNNNDVMAVITDRLVNKSYYVGYLGDEDRDVINYMNINKIVRPEDIASFLDLEMGETVGILDRLYKKRLIRKMQESSGVSYQFL